MGSRRICIPRAVDRIPIFYASLPLSRRTSGAARMLNSSKQFAAVVVVAVVAVVVVVVVEQFYARSARLTRQSCRCRHDLQFLQCEDLFGSLQQSGRECHERGGT